MGLQGSPSNGTGNFYADDFLWASTFGGKQTQMLLPRGAGLCLVDAPIRARPALYKAGEPLQNFTLPLVFNFRFLFCDV